MKRLFVIGNGFDLAHGLKTSYIDFRDWLEEHHSAFLHQLEEMYSVPHYLEVYERKEELREAFKERISHCKLWSDLEAELGFPNYNEFYNLMEPVITDLQESTGYNDADLADTIRAYWENYFFFINFFPKYLHEWVESIDLSNCQRKSKIDFTSDDIFLNFNYTSTVESIYNIPEKQILHIPEPSGL